MPTILHAASPPPGRIDLDSAPAFLVPLILGHVTYLPISGIVARRRRLVAAAHQFAKRVGWALFEAAVDDDQSWAKEHGKIPFKFRQLGHRWCLNEIGEIKEKDITDPSVFPLVFHAKVNSRVVASGVGQDRAGCQLALRTLRPEGITHLDVADREGRHIETLA